MVAASSRPPVAIGPAPRYPVESVDSALRLLLLFAEIPRVRLTDASEYLGVASSTAHRLLAMLQYRGLVQQDATRAYEPGPVLRGFGSAAMRRQDLSGVARPVLERLHTELDSASTLGRLAGPNVVFVENVPNVRVTPPPDRSIPAHCTSVGKMMLSQLELDEVRELYPKEQLERLTYRSISSRAALEEELGRARRRRFAVSDQEAVVGVTSVAVALPGLGGIRYGVSVALPTGRMTSSARGGAVRALIDAAAELSTLA